MSPEDISALLERQVDELEFLAAMYPEVNECVADPEALAAARRRLGSGEGTFDEFVNEEQQPEHDDPLPLSVCITQHVGDCPVSLRCTLPQEYPLVEPLLEVALDGKQSSVSAVHPSQGV